MTPSAAPPRSDESTRARMISAAVECILEEGYYRASSNRIAQRGVTWGVIQYHFGTREQLLLAVVRDGVDDLLHRMQAAKITGDTVEARLDSLADVLWDHYRRPQFLAHVQILLNLGKDPRTSEDTVEALAEAHGEVGRLLQALVEEVVPAGKRSTELGIVIFDLMRGTAIGEGLLEGLPHPKRTPTVRDTRGTLVRALALLLDA